MRSAHYALCDVYYVQGVVLSMQFSTSSVPIFNLDFRFMCDLRSVVSYFAACNLFLHLRTEVPTLSETIADTSQAIAQLWLNELQQRQAKREEEDFPLKKEPPS